MAYVLVKARGRKRRPSWASNVNTGRKLMAMISSEKNRAGPTSLAASRIRSQWGFFPLSRSMCLWAFSIMTMAASTMAPTAMAMPPRLIMLALSPCLSIIIKLMNTPSGRVKIPTRALRKWNKKMMHTRATMILSSMRVFFRLLIALSIRDERS